MYFWGYFLTLRKKPEITQISADFLRISAEKMSQGHKDTKSQVEKMSDNVEMNKWEKLKYHNHQEVLRKFRRIEQSAAVKNIDEKVKTLRTSTLRHHREEREAAISCYGLERAVLKTKFFFSPLEDSDYDFVACWED